MLCEGLCDGWFHRHFAGLSVAHFDALSVSLDPFFCVGCSQVSYEKELMDLRNTVNSISQLRKMFGGKCVYADAFVPPMPQNDGHQMKTRYRMRGGKEKR